MPCVLWLYSYVPRPGSFYANPPAFSTIALHEDSSLGQSVGHVNSLLPTCQPLELSRSFVFLGSPYISITVAVRPDFPLPSLQVCLNIGPRPVPITTRNSTSTPLPAAASVADFVPETRS